MKPIKPVPEAKTRPSKKDRRQAIHRLYVDTSETCKEVFRTATEEELQGMVAANLQVLQPPEDVEMLELPAETVKQIALLANVTLTRMLYERCKS